MLFYFGCGRSPSPGIVDSWRAAVYVPVNLLSMTLKVSHEADRTFGAI